MTDQLERITGFMTLKNYIIEETIDDESCTNTAITFFIITITIASAVYMATWYSRWISLNQTMMLFGQTAPIPTILDIIVEGIGQILFPIVGWFFVFKLGNMIGGEAESKEHLMRTFGYSAPMLLIYHSVGFLNLIPNLSLLVGLLQIVFGLWAIIIYIYATMITFRKGALTAILAFIIGSLAASACVTLPIAIITWFI